MPSMTDWGSIVADELRRDVRFALRFKIGRKQRLLTDSERDLVAAAIVEHIRPCNWKVERWAAWRVCGFETVKIQVAIGR